APTVATAASPCGFDGPYELVHPAHDVIAAIRRCPLSWLMARTPRRIDRPALRVQVTRRQADARYTWAIFEPGNRGPTAVATMGHAVEADAWSAGARVRDNLLRQRQR